MQGIRNLNSGSSLCLKIVPIEKSESIPDVIYGLFKKKTLYQVL